MFQKNSQINKKYYLKNQDFESISIDAGSDSSPVIIVGSGPIGQFVAQKFASTGQQFLLLNGERWKPYNRIKLSSYLSGAEQGVVAESDLALEILPSSQLRHDCRVAEIRPDSRALVLEDGEILPYSKLLLCLGARADIPPIPGAALKGVFTFRDKNDIERLARHARLACRAVVLGGGLLGLEAARGLADKGCETLVIERGPHLMARQLDSGAGALLGQRFSEFGIETLADCGVARIIGDHWVEAIELTDGRRIECDTLVICAGIRANAELAREAGLAVGRGIIVNGRMRTSDPHILAAGDCAEFEGMPTGLVAQGLEQARIMLRSVFGEEGEGYRPVIPPTRLKVAGLDVFSIGDIPALESMEGVVKRVFSRPEDGIYRAIYEKGGRIQGAIALGAWPDLARLPEVMREDRRLWPWEILRYRRTGLLWPEDGDAGVHALPAAAIICNCTGVTKGRIEEAIRNGCTSYEAIRGATGASTVCGSCKPAIEELLGGEAKRSPVEAFRPLAVASLGALAIGLMLWLLPSIPFAISVTKINVLDRLWTDTFLRQMTGYALLASIAIIAMLSFRKRLPKLKLGSYTFWRLLHAGMGLFTLAFLYIHTGGRWGNGLNFWLMTTFVGVAALGAGAGLAIALEHRIGSGPRQAAKLRKGLFWFHLLVSWPLPVLLLVHILLSYFF